MDIDLLEKKNKHDIVISQINNIKDTIQKVKTKLFVATVAYDKYYKRYYIITVLLFIFSSIVTFIEALRLSIIEYVNKDEQHIINEKLLTTIINVLVLALGIVITILHLLTFKTPIVQQKNNLEYLYQTKKYNITFEEIEKIKDEIAEYNTKIESTNILQYLTTKDIIKYNDYKANFDYKIKQTIIKHKNLLKSLDDTENNQNKSCIIIEPYYQQPYNQQVNNTNLFYRI